MFSSSALQFCTSQKRNLTTLKVAACAHAILCAVFWGLVAYYVFLIAQGLGPFYDSVSPRIYSMKGDNVWLFFVICSALTIQVPVVIAVNWIHGPELVWAFVTSAISSSIAGLVSILFGGNVLFYSVIGKRSFDDLYGHAALAAGSTFSLDVVASLAWIAGLATLISSAIGCAHFSRLDYGEDVAVRREARSIRPY